MILAIIDRYSKMIELAATKTKEMEEAAAKFEKRIVFRWSTPDTVFADNAFVGDFKEMCDKHGIELNHSLPYQHASNGLVERLNRTVEERIRNYLDLEGNNWDGLVLQQVQHSIMTTIPAVGYAPFELLTGRESVMPIQRKLMRDEDVTPQVGVEAPGDSEIPENSDTPEESDANQGSKEGGEAPKLPPRGKRGRPRRKQPSRAIAREPSPEDEGTTEIDGPEVPEIEVPEISDDVEPRELSPAPTPDIDGVEEAHRRIQEDQEKAAVKMKKRQEQMIERDLKKKGDKIGVHERGSWVSIYRHVRGNKLEPIRIGPFQVLSQNPKYPANYNLRFLGIPGTELVAHTNDLKTWPDFNPSNLDKNAPSSPLRMPKANQSKRFRRQLKIIREHNELVTDKEIKLHHVVGRRVKVRWPHPVLWQAGKILAHEGNGKFWVQYDTHRDDQGTPYVLEGLLTGKTAQWFFEGGKTNENNFPKT